MSKQFLTIGLSGRTRHDTAMPPHTRTQMCNLELFGGMDKLINKHAYLLCHLLQLDQAYVLATSHHDPPLHTAGGGGDVARTWPQCEAARLASADPDHSAGPFVVALSIQLRASAAWRATPRRPGPPTQPQGQRASPRRSH